jgi:hypothetical protein
MGPSGGLHLQIRYEKIFEKNLCTTLKMHGGGLKRSRGFSFRAENPSGRRRVRWRDRSERLTIGGCQGARPETARQGPVPDVILLGPRNPGGGAFTFLRKLCYDAPAERVRLQEQKLWGIFSGAIGCKTILDHYS